MERDWILRRAVELGASDLILTAGHPALVTIDGKLGPLPESEPLTASDTRRLGESLITSAQRDRFERELELDTRFHLPGVGQFRDKETAFGEMGVQRGQWGVALRVVPLTIPLPGEIGLAPHVAKRLLGLTRGLVLVTGPTGAGKSTTIASLLEQLNQGESRRHVITIEDPIEFVFEAKNSVFDQREVGADTRSFARGLKGALRQLPDVIFVGEMRDLSSMAIALTAAETGNFVISTMATQSAAQTVSRIIDGFPASQQPQVRGQLALTLRAVVSQLLLPRAAGPGRVAAREIMFVTPAIQNLIREDKIHQIPNAIATGLHEDMLSINDALSELVERGLVSFETAYPHFDDPDKLEALQKRNYRLTPVPEAGATR